MEKRFFDCITEFIFLEHEPERADVIFVPGGDYPDGARRAAALFKMGYAPYVLPSGRYSKIRGYFQEPAGDRMLSAESACSGRTAQGDKITQNGADISADETKTRGIHSTEWEYLRDILLENGVLPDAVLKEDKATFTWENAIYSKKLLDSMGIEVTKAIIVCQAFHARRCSMYYQEQFPDTILLVCPVQTKGITRENWYLDESKIDIVLGEVERCGKQFHEIMKDRIREKPQGPEIRMGYTPGAQCF